MIKLIVFLMVYSADGGQQLTMQEEWFDNYDNCHTAGQLIVEKTDSWYKVRSDYVCVPAQRWKS